MAKILVVEDDLSLAQDLCSSLKVLGHTSESVNNGEDALHLLKSFDFDIIILDWDLPGISGLKVCQEFRKKNGVAAILFLTGHTHIDDKESGFESGADDYLTKPFEFKELSLRVNALLKRRRLPVQQDLCIDGVRLNIQKRALFIRETEYYLTPKETALLEFLMRNANQAFNADALLRAVWPSNSDGSVASVRSWMRLLRQKFNAGGEPDFITTLPGSGYMIKSNH
ncbi:MAG: response regulator transcription factor [Candidatus Obscuribacterales bacterium]|nr:response regulator transcription factor [Candidatus Obscuribacterales bacterium]